MNISLILNNMSDSNLKQFVFAIACGLECMHGNPGNISVYAMLYENNFEMDVSECEKKFKEKYVEHKDEPGWLWIAYKDICKKSIDDTMKLLHEL